MKKITVILMMLSVLFTYAQKERTLVLNEDTRLIEVTYFHDNGEISQTGFYNEQGKLHGEWYSFCQEGNKLISARYDNGKKVGTWMYWKGDTVKEVDYSKNEITQVINKTSYSKRLASNK